MNDFHVLKGSEAWARIQRGIPENVQPKELRDILHDYGNIIGPIVAHVNALFNENTRLKLQIEKDRVQLQESALREVEKINKRIDRRRDEHDGLRDDLLLEKTGRFATSRQEAREYTDKKTGKLTAWLMAAASALMVSAILLALNLGVGGSS